LLSSWYFPNSSHSTHAGLWPKLAI
jgi:hypothetical protein